MWITPIELADILVVLFVSTQGLYATALAIDAYLFTRPVNWVDNSDADDLRPDQYPYIVLLYPVLNELKETMRTTFGAISRIEYPRDKFRVVAIPNSSDVATRSSLRELQEEFPFLQLLDVPPTSDPSWDVVWKAWDDNPKAYWWHTGKRRGVKTLPPKKTRQLIYAFYTLNEALRPEGDFLVDYIDADSCPPPDHFMAAAAGIQKYDVLQAQNIAGNLNTTLAASWHAFDHMAWDGLKYPHTTANGRHPYWVLGKGLFFKASDLEALGGFHPWITIEDPEVGMRFWANGKRLGVIRSPLIEEVPSTFAHGVTQRKRWICGFFQSLGQPARQMGLTPLQRIGAWLNFLPCLSLVINVVGLPIGAWALWQLVTRSDVLPSWTLALAAANLIGYGITMSAIYLRSWKRAAIVLPNIRDRAYYILRVNPVFISIYWLIWLIPLAMGIWMYIRDSGLVWERTEKIDANHSLIRKLAHPHHWNTDHPTGAGRASTAIVEAAE